MYGGCRRLPFLSSIFFSCSIRPRSGRRLPCDTEAASWANKLESIYLLFHLCDDCSGVSTPLISPHLPHRLGPLGRHAEPRLVRNRHALGCRPISRWCPISHGRGVHCAFGVCLTVSIIRSDILYCTVPQHASTEHFGYSQPVRINKTLTIASPECGPQVSRKSTYNHS